MGTLLFITLKHVYRIQIHWWLFFFLVLMKMNSTWGPSLPIKVM